MSHPTDSRKLLLLATIFLVSLAVSACGDDRLTAPATMSAARLESSRAALAQEVRTLARQRGITPLVRPAPVRPALVRLGQALAFDKILSGNRDISCMTCHLPSQGTGDGRSLSIGAGGVGLGPSRTLGRGFVIARNAPPLFNLFALDELFWDGRVSRDAQGNYHSPADGQLTPPMTRVFEFGAVSAQGLLPVVSRAEMRGDDNELAKISDRGYMGIWQAIMRRLGAIPEYRQMFEAAYPGTKFDQMNFAYATNAIAGFLIDRLSFADTPWDRFLAGDDGALTDEQLAGAKDFLTLRCSVCHSGAALSDGQFHNVAMPQIGPGAGDGPDGHDDFGRFRVSGNPRDRYAFRTTPLRNVEMTGPFGHAGQFVELRDFIAHYGDSEVKLRSYDTSQLDPALRATLVANADAILATRDPLLDGVVLPDDVVDRLRTYMTALNDPSARDLSRVVPARVPSGLGIDQ